jgi:protein TonB
MNTKKHTDKLQKSSLLFFQLGLVLALLTAYVAIEHKTEIVTNILPETEINIEPYAYYKYDNIKIEEKVAVKKKTATLKKTFLDDINTTKDDSVEETPLPFDKPDEKKGSSNVDVTPELVDVDEEEGLDGDSHLTINGVEEVPVFPGCEKVEKSEKRACFEDKIRKHVSRKFDASLVSNLGLSSGKKRIFIEFLITKNGEIEITNTKAPHKRLEKEGKRVVKKLPKMTPGKQNGKEVNVKYILPIIVE